MFSSAANPASLFAVDAIKLSEPKKERNCFGFALVDNGQKRSPEPPESKTALNVTSRTISVLRL
jgi:hypothetical protein